MEVVLGNEPRISCFCLAKLAKHPKAYPAFSKKISCYISNEFNLKYPLYCNCVCCVNLSELLTYIHEPLLVFGNLFVCVLITALQCGFCVRSHKFSNFTTVHSGLELQISFRISLQYTIVSNYKHFSIQLCRLTQKVFEFHYITVVSNYK